MKKRFSKLLIGAALLMQANGALAEVSGAPNSMVGSDTLDQVMFTLLTFNSVNPALTPNALPLNGLPNGILRNSSGYLGLGSTAGLNAMLGTPTGNAPTCTNDNGGENSGCQEIAPMSGPMSSTLVCVAGNSEANGEAEGMAVCDDGLVVYSDNRSAGAFGDSAAACSAWNAAGFPLSNNNTATPFVSSFPYHGVANLRDTGSVGAYNIGTNGFTGNNAWKDILRVIYTGCLNNQGDCASPTITGGAPNPNFIPRLTRCSATTNPTRAALASNWANIVEGSTDCANGACPQGLRRAYRRDDASGTTRVFLSFLGVAIPSLTPRSGTIATPIDPAAQRCGTGAPLIRPIPETHAFCDGGDRENFYLDCQNGTVIPDGGDPIRKSCAPEDDVCNPRGNGGLVQAIKSTPAVEQNPFPTRQCTANAFRYVRVYASTQRICPDGTLPNADFCLVPVAIQPGGSSVLTYSCMHPLNNRAPNAGTADGRSYNHAVRPDSATGSIVYSSPSAPFQSLEVASWRMNMATMEVSQLAPRWAAGFAYAATERVCQEQNATSQIGCVVANTSCTMGFGGRQAAWDPGGNDYSPRNEPFVLNNVTVDDANIANGTYPFARPLYLNALGGFENVSADCAARRSASPASPSGADVEWCADQLTIANAFYNIGPASPASNACIAAGYIPRQDPTCVGQTSCGAPAVQAVGDCQPM
jgi:hypothetical protein